jgi:ribosomal protein L37AE/L43A
MEDSITAKPHSLRCPFCEVYELEPSGHNAVRCISCGITLTGPNLQTLKTIVELPDARGSHACECGHPEMRRLPDGVYRCPACGSEVLPISQMSGEGVPPKREERA